jgi:hypothetical protein
MDPRLGDILAEDGGLPIMEIFSPFVLVPCRSLL